MLIPVAIFIQFFFRHCCCCWDFWHDPAAFILGANSQFTYYKCPNLNMIYLLQTIYHSRTWKDCIANLQSKPQLKNKKKKWINWIPAPKKKIIAQKYRKSLIKMHFNGRKPKLYRKNEIKSNNNKKKQMKKKSRNQNQTSKTKQIK